MTKTNIRSRLPIIDAQAVLPIQHNLTMPNPRNSQNIVIRTHGNEAENSSFNNQLDDTVRYNKLTPVTAMNTPLVPVSVNIHGPTEDYSNLPQKDNSICVEPENKKPKLPLD